ncbi:YdcH family protein [Marinobacter qingdaonensis]|uniref:DUF465 domain-containing protein n=1 Tax=Marinobacter qingdaonensis TaxID=3108486 RepID=A0ABU5P243_9GAMM|nr:DUF465 domain-containing protein [Marinobacter sp. ASW11-75]MEA1082138.1 DUF465 domain-containing protein [Marinobacter sp. ASW11-75]
MGISNHQLHQEFPQYRDLIDELRNTNPKFGDKFNQYAELDQEIEGLELRDAPIGDDKLHRLKQKRVQLKDEIYQALVQNGRGT